MSPSLRFDRGTLLLEEGSPPGPPRETLLLEHPPRLDEFGLSAAASSTRGPNSAQLPAAELAGLRWDPRVGSHRAPAHRASELACALAAIGVRVAAPPSGPGGRMVTMCRPALRPYQEEALAAWERAGRRGIVVLPTGSGKTHVALAAMALVRRPALVMVPTRVLLAQWAERIRGVYEGPIGQLGDGARRIETVTVATFESAYRHLDDIAHRFGLVVVDEVHHFAGGLRAEALEMCPAPARLGLTATPPADRAARARLALLVGAVVCHHTVGELAGTHLAPFNQLCMFVDLTPAEREAYRRARSLFDEAYRRFRASRGGASSWQEFATAAMTTREGRRALAGFHEARRIVGFAAAKLELAARLVERSLAPGSDERVLVFTADNAAAYALSRRLLIPALTCDIKRAERARVLERLRAGELRAVVSARVLNEGLDLPDAGVGIVLGGALGTREHVQRVGRLLRPRRGKRAVVYEIVVRESFEVRHAERRQLSLSA
jgi:superfamily II DNA or RNA helicase